MVCLSRGSGAGSDVFGLVTPTRPPYPYTPHTSVTTIYYIYIEYTGGLGGVVEWGHETKNNHNCPDPRDNCQKSRRFEKERLKLIIMIFVSLHLNSTNLLSVLRGDRG